MPIGIAAFPNPSLEISILYRSVRKLQTHTQPAKSLRNMFNYGNECLLAQLSAIRGANRPIAEGQSEYFITKSPSGHTNKYIKAKSR